MEAARTTADQRAKKADRRGGRPAKRWRPPRRGVMKARRPRSRRPSRATGRAVALSDALARLASAVPAIDATAGGSGLLGWIEQGRAEPNAAKTERDRYDAAVRKAKGELAKAQLALANAAAAATQAVDRHEQLLEEQARLQSAAS